MDKQEIEVGINEVYRSIFVKEAYREFGDDISRALENGKLLIGGYCFGYDNAINAHSVLLTLPPVSFEKIVLMRNEIKDLLLNILYSDFNTGEISFVKADIRATINQSKSVDVFFADINGKFNVYKNLFPYNEIKNNDPNRVLHVDVDLEIGMTIGSLTKKLIESGQFKGLESSPPWLTNNEEVLKFRMRQSVLSSNSPGELQIFDGYFHFLFECYQLGLPTEDYPILLPQVWMNVDFLTGRERRHLKMPSFDKDQRNDFVLFFPNKKQVIIEVDGTQHYGNQNGTVNAIEYASLQRKNRELLLQGIEVYRFGAEDFKTEQGISNEQVKNFFSSLFQKHGFLNID